MGMQKRLHAGVAAVTAIVALTIVAVGGAGGAPQSTTLTGAAEVPGPGDPDGSGSASLRLNPGQKEICYELTVADIAPATAAHIHIGGPTVAGRGCKSVDRDLVLDILKNPAGFYVNVHNSAFLAGAVRGQLSRP